MGLDRLLPGDLHGLFPPNLPFGLGAFLVDLSLTVFDCPGLGLM
ncbi:hypothetical protein N599_11245 [Saccharopolyspora erythraea D]|nr:hypothetical protein N599_11245 [Saccharopolyspora erythraea D]